MNTIISSISFPVFTFFFVLLDIVLLSNYVRNWKKHDLFARISLPIFMFLMVPSLISVKYCSETSTVSEWEKIVAWASLLASTGLFLTMLAWNFVKRWKAGKVPKENIKAILWILIVGGGLMLFFFTMDG